MKIYQLPKETVNIGQLEHDKRMKKQDEKVQKRQPFKAQSKQNTIGHYLETLSKTVREN